MKEVKPSKKPLAIYYAIVLLVLLVINLVVMPWLAERQVQEVDYGTFMSMTEQENIGKVDIQSNQIIFTDKDNKQIYKTGLMNDPGLTERLYDAGAQFSSEIVEQGSPVLSFLLWFVLPILLFSFIGNQMNKKLMEKAGGGPGSMMFGGAGKSNAKVYVQSTHGIRFADVAGEDEAKENLQEIVNYLHDPKKYEEIGASMPKGILLVGPPGTGKTMLAKAVAGESNVPFFSISGSEFVEMFVGMGASKVRDLFKQAKEKAPCIVFIDEIDAIGQKRNSGQFGGNDEREQTLNQLLTEMDGFEGNTGVIILAATNRPDSLDPALTRPGRFDRRVPVELPDLKGREEILKVHAKKVKIAPGVDFNTVARMASGASGAELANIVNEAALRAVRAGRKSVTQADLEESIEVVIAGYQKKNSILTDHEKCIVAYHEIGHALVAAKQSNSAPVQKITIIPRTSIWADLLVGEDTVRVFNNHLHSTEITVYDAKYLTTHRYVSDTAREEKIRSILSRLCRNSVLRAEQVDTIRSVMAATPYRMIVCGDFNDTPISYTHRVASQGLNDAFTQSGQGLGISYNQNKFYFRIDHILTSKNLQTYNCTVDKSIKDSDHYPIWCYFTFKEK